MGNQMVENLLQTLRSSMTPGDSNTQALKPGQITSGKILKLYPNQKALIQLGGQQTFAQLEASLNLHDRYWFQVQSTGQLTYLKVIGDDSLKKGEKGTIQLLNQLGLQVNKENKDFVQTLNQRTIPFQKSQLSKALQVLNENGQKNGAKQVLIEMLERKLPITKSVFQALNARTQLGNYSLAQELDYIQNKHTNQAPKEQQLQAFVKRISGQTTTPITTHVLQTALQEVVQDQSTTFQLLQKAQLIPINIPFSQWKQQWQKGIDLKGVVPLSQIINTQAQSLTQIVRLLSNNQSDSPSLFSSLEAKDWIQKLSQLFQQQLPLTTMEKQQVNKWVDNMRQRLASVKPEHSVDSLSRLTINLENQGTFHKLAQFLQRSSTKTSHSLVTMVQQSPQSREEVQQQLKQTDSFLRLFFQELDVVTKKQLSNGESRQLTHWLMGVTNESNLLFAAEKDGILLQLKSFFQLSGLNDEHRLMNLTEKQWHSPVDPSLKQLLLQVMSESNSQQGEKMQQILQQLNGMQLSVRDEGGQILQMSFQIPGKWMGLHEDLFMDIEGRKTENNEIDPSYCHILFYLQLEHLQETVIDMHIQKRIVQLTLFNEGEHLQNFIPHLKPSLQKGLESLDYQLSNIQVVPLSQSQPKSEASKVQSSEHLQGGFDFRV